ncbi:MAG: hypothetical protein IPH43_07775 [Xanthomonadales bacterium]|nr:hypothetical protein [Xanthomonadales bacterium]
MHAGCAGAGLADQTLHRRSSAGGLPPNGHTIPFDELDPPALLSPANSRITRAG